MSVAAKIRIQKFVEEERSREYGRSSVKDGFKGRLLVIENNREVEVEMVPVDVSHRGLGVMTKHSLQSGQKAYLEVHGKKYSLEVMWCQNHLGIENLYRCGFFIRDSDADLLNLFDQLKLTE